MSRGVAKRSSIFLLELIVAIMLFAIASGVCIRVYVGSRVKSTEAGNMNFAVMAAQNTAELLYFEDGDLNTFMATYPKSQRTNLDAIAYFNFDWVNCPQSEGAYSMSVKTSYENGLMVSAINVKNLDNGKTIYELNVNKYIQSKL